MAGDDDGKNVKTDYFCSCRDHFATTGVINVLKLIVRPGMKHENARCLRGRPT